MNWSLHQLFPICPVPHCPKFQTRHMLPHQEEIATQILTGHENYIYWQGGVGSAKTLLWGALAAAFMLIIPGSRIILCRRDYGLLFETLWRYFSMSIEAACEQHIINAKFSSLWSTKKPGDYTVCKLPNGSLARAVQLKDWKQAMGPSYDAIFISDAMENEDFGTIFHGEGTVGGLQSRLRGQPSSFFKDSNNKIKDMRRFLVESNPPPNINELHEIFGKEPGVRKLPKQEEITYRHIQTSSILNDHNPSTYMQEIASQHTDPADIKRILEGKTIPYYGGIRVYKAFSPEFHISKIEVDENLPLFVGIDPGKQHPAVIFCQIKKCMYEKDHFITLSEITNLYDKTTYQLAEIQEGELLGILSHLGLFYPSHFDYEAYKQIKELLISRSEDGKFDSTLLYEHFSNIFFSIDRSGEKEYSTSKDRETDRSILRKYYGIKCKYRTNIGLSRSLDRMEKSFSEMCICEYPIQLVDQKCSLLIDAYSGGYRYKKNKDGSHDDKPLRDFRYEDIADAHRYCEENFFFLSGFEGKEEKENKKRENKPWSWLENGI